MAFAIEVPGEANPLTPQQIYQVLQSATSSQQQSIQTATKQLQTWETQRGYYSLLQVGYLLPLFFKIEQLMANQHPGRLSRQVTAFRNTIFGSHST